MNFGALGLIIGHEISHGFDPFGKNYDHKGDYKNTWTPEADSHYRNRASCYVEHYNDYHIPSVMKTKPAMKIIMNIVIAWLAYFHG